MLTHILRAHSSPDRRSRSPFLRRGDRRWTIESLEDRRLLSGDAGTFAYLITGGSALAKSRMSMDVRPVDFTLSHGGILLGMASQGPTGGAPAATPMKMIPEAGSYEGTVLQNDHPVMGGTSFVIAQMGWGRHAMQMAGGTSSSATTRIAVSLIGDVDGDGCVTRRDLGLIRSDLGQSVGSPGYTLAADVDRDGVIDREDLRLARRNLGAATTVRPLSVSVGLARASNRAGNGVVTASRFQLTGRTAPGARVVVLTDGVTAGTATANSRGNYHLHLTTGTGMIGVQVAAADAFGQQAAAPMSVTRGDDIIAWNATALEAARADMTVVGLLSRNLAMVSAAVYDAVNAIDHIGAVYHVALDAKPGASPNAAASQAAYNVLLGLYPSQKSLFNATLAETLGTIDNGPAKAHGRDVGRAAARSILAWRANDGSSTMMTYTPETAPGQWQPTPPDYMTALEPMWGQVTPFGVPSAMAFLPPPPPPMDSPAYTAAFNEVRSLGALNSTTRTPEQTQTGLFWAYDLPGMGPPPIHYNQIAEEIALEQHNTFDQNARMFALVDIAMADAGIVAWDAKYTYDFWRPVTAIRDAGSDGNPDTVADPNWMPLGAPGEGVIPNYTPPFPAYISGHATFGSTLFQTLADFYQTDHVTFTITSDELPGVTRTYTSFSAAAEENGQSRIYLGIHWAFDKTEGIATGDSIANYVVAHDLTT